MFINLSVVKSLSRLQERRHLARIETRDRMEQSHSLPPYHVPRTPERVALNDACCRARDAFETERLKIVQHLEAREPLGKTTLCEEIAGMCAEADALAPIVCAREHDELLDFVAALVTLRNEMQDRYPEGGFSLFDMGLYAYLCRYRPLDANSVSLVGAQGHVESIIRTSMKSAGTGFLEKLLEQIPRAAGGAVSAGVASGGAVLVAQEAAASLATIWVSGAAAGGAALLMHTAMLVFAGLKQNARKHPLTHKSPELTMLLGRKAPSKSAAEDALVVLLAQDLAMSLLQTRHPVLPVFIFDNAMPETDPNRVLWPEGTDPVSRWRAAVRRIAMWQRGSVTLATSLGGGASFLEEFRGAPCVGQLLADGRHLGGLELNAVEVFLRENQIAESEINAIVDKLRGGGPSIPPMKLFEWCSEHLRDRVA